MTQKTATAEAVTAEAINASSVRRSDKLDKIAPALAIFHKEVGKIPKTEKNPFFKSTYASLSNILDAIKDPLEKAELIVSQFPTNENELTTILLHSSGQYFEASYYMRPVKTDPQSYGSVITYQRRYALAAILGLNIDEDDDGNSASQPAKAVQKPAVKAKPKVDPVLVQKNKIFLQLQKLGFDKTKDSAQAVVLEKTQLELVEKNFDEIIERLEILITEKNDN